MGLLQYFHESTLPRIHSIVWCRLPDSGGNPGKSVTPALVRGSERHPPTHRGALYLSLGTTKLDTNNCREVDLIIQNAARLAQLDLPMAVRFDLGTTIWFPWAAEFFQPPEHSIYVVAGPLNENELGRLRVRLKRRGIIQAL
jgi:hypothetical protein